MKRWIIPFLLVSFALGQKGKPAPAPPSPVITDELTAYLLPDDLKLRGLPLQLEWAEREAANQTMQVQIEKNKARQLEITQAIQKIWGDYAVSKQIDLKLFEPDPKAWKFVKKKAALK
jgi:hypothetical protein